MLHAETAQSALTIILKLVITGLISVTLIVVNTVNLQFRVRLFSFLGSILRIVAASHGFPGGSVVKNPPANAGDSNSIPGSGRSLGVGNGNPLQHSRLGNPMDRGAWRAI